MWYKNIDMCIQEMGFVRSWVDRYVYSKKPNDHLLCVVLYVNDMLLVGNNIELMREVKSQFSSKFDMKDLGVAHFLLGMDIKKE